MTSTVDRSPARPLPRLALLGDASPAPSRPAFAWLCTLANAWILAGLFVDGWFHIHDPDLESFFTPWHGLLYSGVAAAVVLVSLEVRREGRVPDGYLPTVAGGLVVGFAGSADMVWHTVLGVEADVAALLSPPHLLLITAGVLVFAGPLRAALRTADPRLALPAALSAAAVVTGLGFFTQYASPYTQLFPTDRAAFGGGTVADAGLLEVRQVAGVAGLLVFVVLLTGAVAVLRARTPLPPGAVLLAVAVPSAAMTTLHAQWQLVPGVLLAAAVAEAGRRLRPAPLGALTGTAVSAAWVLSLLATDDVVWGAELLTGSVASAAAAGFLVGWLVQAGGTAPALPGQVAPSGSAAA